MTLLRQILAIALPAIVATVTTPLLGLVDVAITGHIGSPAYLAAIALGGAVFNMIYWLFNFLRMGTTGFTAQSYGTENTVLILWRSLTVAAVVGLVILLLNKPLVDIVLRFLDSDAATRALAGQYCRILIWGAPAVMATYTLSGWFLGMQDSKAQMWTAIATNLLNIGASLVFVYVLNWKMRGVASGTLLAQWGGLAVAAAVVWRKYRPKRVPFSKVLEIKPLLSFFRVNTDIFLRTACLVAVTLWFTHMGAMAGTDILAANAILLQLFMFFSYFMDGFGFAAEALAGKYAGKKQFGTVTHLVHKLMKIGFAGAVVFSAVYLCAGEVIVSILTDDSSVRAAAVRYLPWAVAVPVCGFAAFVWDGVFVGLVNTRSMLLSMATAAAVFALLCHVARALGNDGLWLAFDAYLLVRGAVLGCIFLKIKRKNL